jgi:hypothetical protein
MLQLLEQVHLRPPHQLQSHVGILLEKWKMLLANIYTVAAAPKSPPPPPTLTQLAKALSAAAAAKASAVLKGLERTI